jgi:pilus assembly protein Flp/PilA
MRRIFALFKDQKAATAVEYGLILALIFLAMIAGVSNFATATINMWNNVEQKVRTS